MWSGQDTVTEVSGIVPRFRAVERVVVEFAISENRRSALSSDVQIGVVDCCSGWSRWWSFIFYRNVFASRWRRMLVIGIRWLRLATFAIPCVNALSQGWQLSLGRLAKGPARDIDK